MKKPLPRVIFFSLFAILLIVKVNAQSKSAVAINYIERHAALLRLNSADVADVRLIDENTDAKTGISHVYLSQFYKGISVYNAVAGIHINSQNEVVYSNSSFQNNLEQKVKNAIPSLSAGASAAKAFQHLNIPITRSLAEVTSTSGKPYKPNEYHFAKDGIALQDISSELMWLPSGTMGQIALVWKVNIYKTDASEWWDVFVDAKTGDIVTKNNLVISCDFTPPAETDSAMTQAENSSISSPYEVNAANDFNVIVRPAEAPSFASRTIINSPWNLAGAAASPFGWLNDGTVSYTYTRGNNVWAYLDTNNINTASVPRSADGGKGLNFNFPIDFSKAPQTYARAATTQLFYANNTMHDIWYHYGFNEASRNFQKSNNGQGGLANDAVNAEAQDSRNLTPCVRDNANMATVGDGASPRMQMYLWSATVDAKINSPASIAGNDPATSSGTFGPCIATTNVSGNVAIANPADGCDTLTNTAAMAGKIALVDRGTCAFTLKVKLAQDAGAIGVIIVNNVAGPPIGMSGTDATITIPAIMVSDIDGAAIKTALGTSAVNVTLTTTTPELDGDLDNGIMFHEYGHGITHRLTGNGSSCMSNAERGDEGWSDWYALVCTQKPGDNANTPRSIGTYVVNQAPAGTGIRGFPYSYNMTVNPHTYSDVQTSGGEVHTIGEVWCSALWDMYWLMINKYGYDPNIYTGTGGNNKCMQLVIDGLKMQLCSPGFLDSRDAILSADTVDNGAANSCLIWSAFARRGMGFSAVQGSSGDTNDQTAAFDVPTTCSGVVLPVTLVSLKATGIDNKINIAWKTEGEYNNAGFELQRKSSLTDPFVTVATIAAKGTNGSGFDYSFDDMNVAANILYYYQLIQKDKDGKKNFSQVVTAIIRKHLPMNVSIYPNPAGKVAYLQFGDGFKNDAAVKISDVFGRVVYNKTLHNVSNSRVALDVSNYAAGVYEINVNDTNNNAVLRIIKK
ncbi:MAG: M36 family metallopeptidase [Ginsengibacter sp.]